MRKIISKARNLPYHLAAAATVALYSGNASAQTTIGSASDGLLTQMSSVGKLMVAGGFVGGLVMLASGLMKLKQAADTQGNQVKYSEGMWRVAVGAGLVAIPAFSGMLTQSFGLGEVGTTISPGGGAGF